MKYNFVITLLVLYFVAIEANYLSAVPSLAWSGANFINFKNGQALQTIKQTELSHFVDTLLGTKKGNSIFEKYFTDSAKPATVVVFVLPEQISESLFTRSSTYLKTVLENSVSSFSIPYTQIESLSVGAFSSKFINNLSPEITKILVATKLGERISTMKTVETISVESILQKDSIFENGLPQLFIICLDSNNLDLIESIVQRVNIGVTQNAKGKSVSFLTFTSSLPHILDIANAFVLPEFNELAANSTNNSSSTNYTYAFNFADFFADFWPGYILQGVIISFIVLFILFVGLCCMCAIQTPKSFEEPKGNAQ